MNDQNLYVYSKSMYHIIWVYPSSTSFPWSLLSMRRVVRYLDPLRRPAQVIDGRFTATCLGKSCKSFMLLAFFGTNGYF